MKVTVSYKGDEELDPQHSVITMSEDLEDMPEDSHKWFKEDLQSAYGTYWGIDDELVEVIFFDE